MKKQWFFILYALGLLGLFALDLCVGQASVDFSTEIGRRILLDLRLPQAVTAVLAGAGLSVSGLMMQTLFRNPLAGPYILGVSSGAGLGVAIVTMLAAMLGFSVSSSMIAPAAIIGGGLVMLLVMALARKVQNNVTLLIVGLMIGSMAGALVNVIQNYANPDSLKLFIVWTLGSLSGVGWKQMAWMAPIVIVGLILTIILMKPMNGMILGEQYAKGLGVNVKRVRWMMILGTSLLAGGITAFCGPIAFIGVAVPHLARISFDTSNHRLTIPATMLIGADILLICDIICSLSTYPLPVSTVSALFAAPIIITILIRGNK